VDRLLGECGIPKDSEAGRKEFESRLERRRKMDQGKDFDEVRAGWCFGDEEFRRELLAQVKDSAHVCHYGRELREAAEDKALCIVAEELSRIGWTDADLRTRRKGVPQKLAMARRLRNETTMTLAWIADRLDMGVKGHLSHLLYWENRPRPDSAIRGKKKAQSSQSPARFAATDDSPATASNTSLPMTDPISLSAQFDTSFD
jgi:hypothetical protein